MIEVVFVVYLRLQNVSIAALCFVGSSAAHSAARQTDHSADVLLSTYLSSDMFSFAMPLILSPAPEGGSVQAVVPCEERMSWFTDAMVFLSETESCTRRGWR